LHIEIENSGRWIPESNESGQGIKNAADRLATAYSENHTFGIEKGENSVKVSITINPEE
jgi:LytS/YehU family sensor histidine kinase